MNFYMKFCVYVCKYIYLNGLRKIFCRPPLERILATPLLQSKSFLPIDAIEMFTYETLIFLKILRSCRVVSFR